MSIELRDLQVGYRASATGRHTVLGPVNAEIKSAEMVGIIGRNGIGKSTLLRTIAGLQPCISGLVLIHGVPNHNISLREMAKTVSFVSTEPVHAFQIGVNEMIAMGRFPYTGWLGKLEISDRKAIHKAIELTGISHLLSKSIHELSDGERQKVMIARALAQDTPVIILDEPTAFLDLPARYEILRILNDLSVIGGKTILFSTHDLSLAMDVADKLWLLADNNIFQGAPEDLLISKVFRKLFLNSPAEFDPKTSTFRFSRYLNREVEIRGDKRYMVLTRKAMERIGFRATNGGSEVIIDVAENEGKPLWHLQYKDNKMNCWSIYELASQLKNYSSNK